MTNTRSFSRILPVLAVFCGVWLFSALGPVVTAVMVEPEPFVYHMSGAHASGPSVARDAKVTFGPGTIFEGEDPQWLVNHSPHDASLRAEPGSQDPIWFTVDLGRPYDITSISLRVHYRGDDGTWAGQGRILVSDDGVDFKLLADRLSGCRVLGTNWDTTKQNHRTHTSGGTTVILGRLDGIYVAKGARYLRMELPNSNLITQKTHILYRPWPTLFRSRWVVNGINVRADPAGAGRVIPKADEPIRFDDRLSGWEDMPGLELNQEYQFRGRHWSGPEQLSGRVKLMADEQHLYVAANVTQNGPAANELRDAGALSNDCVELFLNLQDLRNISRIDLNAQSCELAWSTTQTESGFEYHLVLNPGSSGNQPQIWFMKRTSGLGQIERQRVRGTNDGPAVGGNIQVFNKPDGRGYVVGARIPLANFGAAKLSSGIQIGIDATVRSASMGHLDAMIYQSGNASIHVDEWDRAFVFDRDARHSGGDTAVIAVDANTVRSFNGHDSIVREIFGVQTGESLSKHMANVWEEESGCFGRIYFQPGFAWSGWVFPEWIGKTEAEKRALIYDPSYWERVDMDKVTSLWAMLRHLADAKPTNLFILLASRAYQLEAEAVFGTKPPSLTPEQQAILKRTGQEGSLDELIRRAGEEDASPLLNKDRDLYAELVVNLVAKVKEIMPDTRISITLCNEGNNLSNMASERIMDDMWDSLEKYGSYRAGRVAAEEWLSQYNVLYTKMKARFPDVLVGGPDVIGMHFTMVEAGRLTWNDFVMPILDGVVGMDFFDFHYALNPEVSQIFLELADQYMQQNRGWSVRSVDSESGSLTWHKGSGSVTQYMNAVKNQQEWFAYLRNPDLTFGLVPIDMASYYDGFGQAKIPAMGREMFMTLRGRYVEVTTDAPDIETVAALNGDTVVCVAFNNGGKDRDVEFQINAPKGAVFKEYRGRLSWFDPRTEKVRYVMFKPVAIRRADGLVIKATMPPFSTCTVDIQLDREGKPSRVSAVRRFIADKVAVMVDPGQSQTFRVQLPAEALRGDKRYLLRVGYEGTVYRNDFGYVGVRPGEARVTVNDQARFELPSYMKANGFGRCHSIELELDGSILDQRNRITFSTKDNGQPFMALVTSIIVQDKIQARAPAHSRTVKLDVLSSDRTITEQPSKTLPEWYVEKTAAITHMPVPVARWSFEEAENDTVADLTGNGHAGQLLNGAKLVEGLIGKAMKLGGGASMKVDSPSLLQTKKDESFAISMWFKVAGSYGGGVMLMKSTVFRNPVAPWGTRYINSPGVTQSLRLSVDVSAGEWGTDFPVPSMRFAFSSPVFVMQGYARTKRDVGDGQWHHVVAMKDGREEVTLIYLDGSYAGSGPGWIAADLDFTDPLYFGVSQIEAQPGGATYSFAGAFDGLIDEVTIYDDRLTPQQVAELYRETR